MNEQFAKHVAILAKPGKTIVNEIDAQGAHLMHMALGICGEAGEIADALKKAAIYNKPLDRDNVVEELGDLLFYMQGVMNDLGISWDEVVKFNITKLAARYPAGYSDQAAQERADKQQPQYFVAESVDAAKNGQFTFGPTHNIEAVEEFVANFGGQVVMVE